MNRRTFLGGSIAAALAIPRSTKAESGDIGKILTITWESPIAPLDHQVDCIGRINLHWFRGHAPGTMMIGGFNTIRHFDWSLPRFETTAIIHKQHQGTWNHFRHPASGRMVKVVDLDGEPIYKSVNFNNVFPRYMVMRGIRRG